MRGCRRDRTCSMASPSCSCCARSRRTSALLYHSTGAMMLSNVVQFINRCKDELVTPRDFEAFAYEERRVFEERYGDAEAAMLRLEAQGNLDAAPRRSAAPTRASARNERAEDRGEGPRLSTRRARARPPTARPAARSPAPARRCTATRFAAEDHPRDRRSSPRATSSTAPPSRSCA